ncbi:hypothetical protein [EBPR podovirus 2]|nr:hypothetical protein [EBPR podovirus 2]
MTRDTNLIRRSLVKHNRDLLLDQANKAMPDSGDEELDHGHRMYRAGVRDLARRLMLAPAAVQEPPSPGVTAGATGGDAAERNRRKNIVDHYAQMMDAQAQCVPCRLCGGKAVITDAGPGFGYTIECENAARFRKPTCLQSGTRISGWAYNVSDLWNRLNATPAPVVPAEGPISTLEMVYRNMPDIPELPEAYQPRNIARSLAALRSAPPVGARVTGWQPIETAPKDGVTEVLMYDPVLGMAVWPSANSPWPNVTHWMPLPEPPAALLPAGEGG